MRQLPPGRPHGWASLVRDGVEIMVSARNAHTNLPEPAFSGSIYITVDNADEFWEALKDKVTVEYPIANFHYNMREFGIRDPDGYLLQFAHSIPPATEGEVREEGGA